MRVVTSQTGLSRRTRSWHRAVPGSESGLGRAQLCLNTGPVHTLSTGKYSSEFTWKYLKIFVKTTALPMWNILTFTKMINQSPRSSSPIESECFRTIIVVTISGGLIQWSSDREYTADLAYQPHFSRVVLSQFSYLISWHYHEFITHKTVSKLLKHTLTMDTISILE